MMTNVLHFSQFESNIGGICKNLGAPPFQTRLFGEFSRGRVSGQL